MACSNATQCTTPKNYIRQKRLERINAVPERPDLQRAQRYRSGDGLRLPALGRFSDSYRKQFGELPSDTLKRRH